MVLDYWITYIKIQNNNLDGIQMRYNESLYISATFNLYNSSVFRIILHLFIISFGCSIPLFYAKIHGNLAVTIIQNPVTLYKIV